MLRVRKGNSSLTLQNISLSKIVFIIPENNQKNEQISVSLIWYFPNGPKCYKNLL